MTAVMTCQRWSEMDESARAALLARGTAAIFDPEMLESIERLIEDVAQRGDAALVDALKRFDDCEVPASRLLVSEEEFDAARKQVSDPVLEGIRVGIENIRTFNQQLVSEEEWRVEEGCGWRGAQEETHLMFN